VEYHTRDACECVDSISFHEENLGTCIHCQVLLFKIFDELGLMTRASIAECATGA
jgi:hypothetical protein